MARDLPNLDWLRVFAACAATESFAAAGSQLGVTAGAISQRIKALESFLGVELFKRHAQGVRLTEAGRDYAQRTATPLDQLTAATRELRSGTGASVPVRITVLPAFAQLWLGPRLEDFHRVNMNANLEVWADPALIDLKNSRFDIAIRYGRPPFPACDHRQILNDELVPVAAPALIEGAELDRLGLPVGVPLNVDSFWSADFEEWVKYADGDRRKEMPIQAFSLYSMVVEATLNRRGFMIGHTSLVSDLLADEKLRVLSPVRSPTNNQFYVLTKRDASLTPMAEAFRDWLFSQAAPLKPRRGDTARPTGRLASHK